jgi:hypothetical protein
MPYYIIKIPSGRKTAYCVESPSPRPDEYRAGDYRMGKYIEYIVPPLKIKTDKDHGKIFPDVIPTQGQEFIISVKFMNLLVNAGIKNIQNFPITVIDCFSKKKYDFMVCNVIGRIPCLDLKKSDIAYGKDGEIFIIRRISVDEKVIEVFNSAKLPADNLHLFRIDQCPEYMVADDMIRNSIMDSGITGIEFKSPEESGDFI